MRKRAHQGKIVLAVIPPSLTKKMERKEKDRTTSGKKTTVAGRYANRSDVVADYIFFSAHFIFIYLQGDSLEESERERSRNRQRQTDRNREIDRERETEGQTDK